MIESSAPTFTATIYIAGDLAAARQVCREFCRIGLCVTVEATEFVYTGGAETGVRVGLLNYPRFPAEPATIVARARALADLLRERLCQHSWLIVTLTETMRPRRRGRPMDERKIARTVAEAEVGDMLWHYDRYRDRYDEKGKWLGRGVWTLVTVFKIARIYLTAGDPKWPRSAGEFSIDTGMAKAAGGYTPSEHVAGSKDRADAFWIARAGEMGSAITRSNDIEVLKTVAFALGLDGPPDFSAPALIAQAEKEASR